jgi:hypothetical protein
MLQCNSSLNFLKILYDKTKIDSILKVRLVDFPKINPAIKRGIL